MRWGAEHTAAPRVAAVGVAVAVCALAGPASGATVRVLLLDRRESVQIEPAGGRPVEVRVGRGGMRVAGRRSGGALRLEGPGPQLVDGRRYRGAIEVLQRSEGLRVVNEVPLEAYVAGTLLGEVGPDWGTAALEAQAVATRSYALYRRARSAGSMTGGLRGGFDLEAGTLGQVYLGMDGESPATWDAVDATRGEVLAFAGQAILAAFHGTSGGRTASAAEVWGEPVPYLVSQPVEGEEASPDTYWRAPVGADELTQRLARAGRPVGRVRSVAVAARSASGRCAVLRVEGSRGSAELGGEALRRLVGETRIRSTLFVVRPAGDGFVFVGSGRGHGVGMSQWGARVMAERGADYRAILRHFYPGAELRHLAIEAAEAPLGPAVAAGAGGS
jgi:stage II sporulation protein D